MYVVSRFRYTELIAFCNVSINDSQRMARVINLMMSYLLLKKYIKISLKLLFFKDLGIYMYIRTFDNCSFVIVHVKDDVILI